MRKLPEMLIGIALFAVSIQVGLAAIQPYLSWIGRTFAIVVIVAILAATVAGVVALLRRIDGFSLGKGKKDNTFNGD